MTDNRLTQFNVADAGLIIKNTSTGDNKPSILSLESNEAAVETGETVGSLNFKVSGEEGGDSIEVCAGIDAVAEADFTTSVNSTKLSFKTGSSEAAAEKMALSSNGNLKLAGSDAYLSLKEMSNAVSDTAEYGQIWVKTATPNELYFTNDAGNDIEITSGSSFSGGGGSAPSSLDDLTDVKIEGANFTNSILIGHTTTGTLSSATDNVGIGGSGTLNSTTSGSRNTAIGHSALTDVTSNNDCTGVGQFSTFSIGTTDNNTLIGKGTGGKNGSTVMGAGSGGSNGGDNNTVFGYNSHTQYNTGGYDTTFGNFAGRLATGEKNVFIGGECGYRCTGDNNIALGYKSNNTATNTNENTIVIGYNVDPSSTSVSNEITLGDGNISNFQCQVTTISSLSDKRDKTDIRKSNYGIDFIENLKPVQYTWDRRILSDDDSNFDKNGEKRIGFLAQDLLEAMPNNENEILDLVYESNPERLEVTIGNLIPILVKSLKDLHEENKFLDSVYTKINNL